MLSLFLSICGREHFQLLIAVGFLLCSLILWLLCQPFRFLHTLSASSFPSCQAEPGIDVFGANIGLGRQIVKELDLKLTLGLAESE